jgi:hypothetical protein
LQNTLQNCDYTEKIRIKIKENKYTGVPIIPVIFILDIIGFFVFYWVLVIQVVREKFVLLGIVPYYRSKYLVG